VIAPAAGVLFLARAAISGIYAKLGHAGATLDDASIHFQYERRDEPPLAHAPRPVLRARPAR
jgi:hypothetical protein